MNGYIGGAGSVGRLAINANNATAVQAFTDWFAIPPICPLNIGVGCGVALNDPAGVFTLQFRLLEGGTIFNHPYIAAQSASIAGNIAFPVQAIRFAYTNLNLSAVLLIPGFQSLTKAYP